MSTKYITKQSNGINYHSTNSVSTAKKEGLTLLKSGEATRVEIYVGANASWARTSEMSTWDFNIDC